MLHYCVIPLTVIALLFCFVKAEVTIQAKTFDKNIYSPVIESICNGSNETESCLKCLDKIITKDVISLKEISTDVVNNMNTCLEKASDDFNVFQCKLYEEESYTLKGFLGGECVKSLQNKTLFLDLDVDLSKTKGNRGYFNLSQVTVTTLMGILKYANDSNNMALNMETPKEKQVCSMISNSIFLPALSQANGNSWKLNFSEKEPFFFEIINKHICKENKTCYQCLESILNTETIKPEETSGEIFLKLLKCKSLVPNNVFTYLSSLDEKKYNLKAQVSETCLKFLKKQVTGFKSDENLNTNDLVADTFYIQELVKFGIGTVFFYLHDTEGTVPDGMILGVCETVILRYTKAFKFAMELLNPQYLTPTSKKFLQSRSPYMRIFERVCERNVYCEACHEKVAYSVDVTYPRETSDTVVKVLEHCKIHQPKGFKDFSSKLNYTSFKACMKQEKAYDELFGSYPLNNDENIQTTPGRPNFSNYKKFLDLVYHGICYYYSNSTTAGDNKKYNNKLPLSTRLLEIELPGAYLYVMPGLNKLSPRQRPKCVVENTKTVV